MVGETFECWPALKENQMIRVTAFNDEPESGRSESMTAERTDGGCQPEHDALRGE